MKWTGENSLSTPVVASKISKTAAAPVVTPLGKDKVVPKSSGSGLGSVALTPPSVPLTTAPVTNGTGVNPPSPALSVPTTTATTNLASGTVLATTAPPNSNLSPALAKSTGEMINGLGFSDRFRAKDKNIDGKLRVALASLKAALRTEAGRPTLDQKIQGVVAATQILIDAIEVIEAIEQGTIDIADLVTTIENYQEAVLSFSGADERFIKAASIFLGVVIGFAVGVILGSLVGLTLTLAFDALFMGTGTAIFGTVFNALWSALMISNGAGVVAAIGAAGTSAVIPVALSAVLSAAFCGAAGGALADGLSTFGIFKRDPDQTRAGALAFVNAAKEVLELRRAEKAIVQPK